MRSQSLTYRHEIDGLRAIAVLGVVLAHARLGADGQQLIPGGHLGVDIFFVISGYVIMRMAAVEIAEGRFSPATFLARRSRRILPALALVLSVSAAGAWFILQPAELNDFGYALFSIFAVIANIHFFREDDYFGEPAETSVLIHTWSLAVEEQFYLLFVAAALALSKSGALRDRPVRQGSGSSFSQMMHRFSVSSAEPAATNSPEKFEEQESGPACECPAAGSHNGRASTALPSIGLGTACALSLAYFVYKSKTAPMEAHYLLPSRAWEILAGAVVALEERRTGVRSSRAGAAAGLVLVLSALFWFGTPTPGNICGPVAAAVGTAALLRYSSGGQIATALSWAPLTTIGLVSYSLYLWHQPVFAFANLYTIAPLETGHRVLLIVICLLLAALTWRFVEQPCRSKVLPGMHLFISLATAIGLLTVFAFSTISSGGFPQRYSADALKFLAPESAQRGNVRSERRPCHRRIEDPCIIGDVNIPPAIALIGDSHADTLMSPLGSYLASQGQSAVVLTSPGCPFIIGAVRLDFSIDCARATEDIIQAVRNLGVRNLILHERASLYLMGTPFDSGEGGKDSARVEITLKGHAGPGSSGPGPLLAAWRATMVQLHELGIRVHYILPVPEAGWHVSRTIAKLVVRNKLPLTTNLDRYFERHALLLQEAQRLKAEGIISLHYPHQVFCDLQSRRCRTHDESNVYYVDSNHLSEAGGRFLIGGLSAGGRFDFSSTAK